MQRLAEFYKAPFYAIHDPKELQGCHEIWPDDIRTQSTTTEDDILLLQAAHERNADNWGIFWAVNEFEGQRQKKNLKKIRAWFCETDEINKETLVSRLSKRIFPSMIIESKRGFHLYWFADESASPDNYSEIIEMHLCPYFEGDLKAKDLARILRVPDFFHCKNPSDKFLIRIVHHDDDLIYSEPEMVKSFPMQLRAEEKYSQKQAFKKEFAQGGDLWIRVFDMDCEKALKRLSGTDAVRGEVYEFRETINGKKAIIVNGKPTSCWLDSAARIGSTDRGGPTIFQWLNWYHRDNKKSFEFLKKYFPEVVNES